MKLSKGHNIRAYRNLHHCISLRKILLYYKRRKILYVKFFCICSVLGCTIEFLLDKYSSDEIMYNEVCIMFVAVLLTVQGVSWDPLRELIVRLKAMKKSRINTCPICPYACIRVTDFQLMHRCILMQNFHRTFGSKQIAPGRLKVTAFHRETKL